MIANTDPMLMQSIPIFLSAQVLPAITGCWWWGIIFVVAYFINVFISARVLLPVGLPESTKLRRFRMSIVLTLILSWPLVYLIIAMLLHREGEGASGMGLAGALAGWVFFLVFGFIANWKLFEMYFPMRKELGGSDAYANLHRHVWGHLVTIAALVITALGVALWYLITY